jgi:hypothetical protein
MDIAERQPGIPKSSTTKWKRLIVNVFISVHLVFLLIWTLPFNARWDLRAKSIIAPYMNLSGLNQGWNLFAPEPQSINAYLVAEIAYRDGQSKTWKFPVPQDFGIFRRYFMARQLKWSADNLRLDDNHALWPDAARYVARLNNQPDNPPVAVTLIRHWSFIPPPQSGQPETWSQFAFFKYTLLPGDLQ